MFRLGFPLRFAAVASAVLLAGCSAPAPDTSSWEPTVQAVTHSSNASADSGDIVYVAFGDSWPYGAHCGMCETFADRYADGIKDALGTAVDFRNQTTNGGSTFDLLSRIKSREDVRADITDADVIMIAIGINDLDTLGTLNRLRDDLCGVDNACLADLYDTWETNFAAILDEIASLRGNKPTVLRLVTTQNLFASDPTLVTSLGLPDDFASTTGLDITRKLSEISCGAAVAHGGQCIDVVPLFNGPDGTKAWDDESPEAHQAVADALVASGFGELHG